MYDIRFTLLLCGSLLAYAPVVAATAGTLQAGQAAYEQGDYAQAIAQWQQALTQDALGGEAQVDLLLRLGVAYQASGDAVAARGTLESALSLAQQRHYQRQQVLLHSHLSDVLLQVRLYGQAQSQVQQGLALWATLKTPILGAHLYNNLGLIHSLLEEWDAAESALTQAETLAQQAGDAGLWQQILSNQVSLAIRARQPDLARTRLGRALDQARPLAQPLRAAALLHLLHLGLEAQRQDQEAALHALLAELQPLASAAAESSGNPQLRAYAQGYRGTWLERQGQLAAAQQATREALFLSQAWPTLTYVWEWQQGRLLQQQGQMAAAEAAYRQALHTLQPLQADLLRSERDAEAVFYQRIRPVYTALADVLLHRARQETKPAVQQALLEETRHWLELEKTAEVQNYFSDPCLSTGRQVQLDQIQASTAVVYPVILPDRVEILLSVRGQLQQYHSAIDEAQLNRLLRSFNRNLQRLGRWAFIAEAAQLYDLFIRPLDAALTAAQIDTLVWVPDGALRLVPVAALFDGERFLVERYALVNTPSLSLTDPRSLPRGQIQVLLGGLAVEVQAFPALPNVRQEIAGISALFPQHQVLSDEALSSTNLDLALSQTSYRIVHLATHGQFNPDPSQTFLLTYQGRLDMDQLQALLGKSQYRQQPVELLTLSACQTAVGNERAALGLAGVAIKAGVRSALASLWFINDAATSELVTAFYKNLQNPALSKAQALQQAQRQLLGNEQFRHPLYWAPFLLIGNWL